MDLSTIKNTGNWGSSAANLNENFSKIKVEIEKLKYISGSTFIGIYDSSDNLPPQTSAVWAFVGDLDSAKPYAYYVAGNVPTGYIVGWNDLSGALGTYNLTGSSSNQFKFNLIDITQCLEKLYIKNDSEKFSVGTDDSHMVTGYIRFVSGQTYHLEGVTSNGSAAVQWAKFDGKKNFMGVFKPVPDGQITGAVQTFTADFDGYARLCLHTGNGASQISLYPDGNVSPSMFGDKFSRKMNLADGMAYLEGYYISNNASFLKIGTESTFSVTPLIKLEHDNIYVFSGQTNTGSQAVQWARFNAKKEFAGVFKPVPDGPISASLRSVYIPEDDCYIMANINNTDKGTFNIECITEDLDICAFNEGVELYDMRKTIRNFWIKNESSSFSTGMDATVNGSNKIPVSKGDVVEIRHMSWSGSQSVQWAKFDNSNGFLGIFKPVDDGLTAERNYLYVSDFDGYFIAAIHNRDLENISIRRISGDCKNIADVNIGNETLYGLVEDANYGRFDFKSVTLSGLYAAFDELTYTFPEFAKSEDIGTSQTPTGSRAEKDPNTYPIKRYTFVKSGSDSSKRVTIMAAIHADSEGEGWYNDAGDSVVNILSVYYFLLDFLSNPKKNIFYDNLYENYILDVIPVLNPWGVQNHSRYNGNDVDLNRNFDLNWNGSTYPHSGSAPFSEAESQAVKNYIESTSGIKMVMEVHARGNIVLPQDNRWLIVGPEDAMTQLKQACLEMQDKYGGTVGTDSSNLDIAYPTCYGWINFVKGIPAFEPELFQSLGNDISTRCRKLTVIQATDYLITLFVKRLYSL